MCERESSYNFDEPFLRAELTWLQPTDKFKMEKKAAAID